ncbi:MAG: phosphotransferase [Tolumonas sp.]|nr:phosphotransferase [Tolumonas sp.]
MLLLPAPFNQADAVLLAQGLTNYTYRLQLQHKNYFYRQGIAQPESLFIDRTQERQALLLAEAAGLLPKIHYHSEDGQQLILAWCDEPSWQMDYFSSAAGITQLGQLAARVHSIPARLKILDLANYLQQLMAGLPSLSQTVRLRVEQQQAMLRALPVISPVFCHNDINPTNLLGMKPWLVDWEYAALGDPAFDLAGICRAGQFDLRQQQTLVNNYQAAGGCCDLNRVAKMLAVVDLVSLLWCEKMLLLRSEAQYHALRQHLYRALGIAEV